MANLPENKKLLSNERFGAVKIFFYRSIGRPRPSHLTYNHFPSGTTNVVRSEFVGYGTVLVIIIRSFPDEK